MYVDIVIYVFNLNNFNETVTLRKHVAKYKTCENEWLNFSENMRIMELKLRESTRFLWPILSIHSYVFNLNNFKLKQHIIPS